MTASGRLRVVGGALAGRRFAATVAAGTRPTSDRVREAIASAIEARGGVDGARVLDLFAGTGAMAIEALSRGAAYAVLVEQDRTAARAIAASVAALGLGDRVRIASLDLSGVNVASRIPDGPFDRVFADPPYAQASLVPALLDALAAAGAIASDAIVVVEHPAKVSLALGQSFETLATKRYGDSAVLFARYAPPA
jgi:16S rRNA (guanine966-N2)-methyltransferase